MMNKEMVKNVVKETCQDVVRYAKFSGKIEAIIAPVVVITEVASGSSVKKAVVNTVKDAAVRVASETVVAGLIYGAINTVETIKDAKAEALAEAEADGDEEIVICE